MKQTPHWEETASYNLQNQNTRRLTWGFLPPSLPSDISGTSWREAISSSRQITDFWLKHSHMFQSQQQPGNNGTWPPSTNSLQTLGRCLARCCGCCFKTPLTALRSGSRNCRWLQSRNPLRGPPLKLILLIFRIWPPNRTAAPGLNASSNREAHSKLTFRVEQGCHRLSKRVCRLPAVENPSPFSGPPGADSRPATPFRLHPHRPGEPSHTLPFN
jgi:hypothetical protein